MTPPANRKPLSARRRQILDAIVEHQRAHGYPPSIREIAAEVGLKSPASVKAHIDVLGSAGYLRVDPTRPRAIEVRYDENSGAALERRPVRHVPLLGDVAAGSGVLAAENVEELVPMPADLTGEGELFMLRVRGDSMIDAGILDGDYVVCR
ncbi:MAG: repressor LexA, partial [Acidimicrobiaceae bacterium]|nr:repressor LexA [Acidimicrobiaceae bacterium]